ncbi:MAG: hypothetical protein ACRDZO_19550 [Egibacteraceae bacterium]
MLSHYTKPKVAFLHFPSAGAVLLVDWVQDRRPIRHTVDRFSVGRGRRADDNGIRPDRPNGMDEFARRDSHL